MDCLFGENNIITDSLDSNEENKSFFSDDNSSQVDSGFGHSMTTTIEKSMDVSPVRNNSRADNTNTTDLSIYDFDLDLSLNKRETTRNYCRNYCSAKKSLKFSPKIKSTPKTSKTTKRRVGRIQTKRMTNKRSDLSLWDRALVKSPELKQWVDSFNDEMKIIESSELSVVKQKFN